MKNSCHDINFYHTALKGCRGIVFTHGVQADGWAGSGKKFVRAVYQKLYSVRKLILGRDIG